MTRTRIVATLGPATSAEEKIRALIDAGVDVFRLNFSHGTHESHGRALRDVRRLAGSRPVAVLQDLGGPKLRLDRPVRGKPGDVVSLPLPESVRAGDPVLLADGRMELEVVDAQRSRVVVGGDVAAGKGINLPSSPLEIPSLTDKDRADLKFGAAEGVDLVAVSFVRRAADLEEARRAGRPVVAKIEKPQAVEHLEEILQAADAVMVARGDLGVEIPIERVPVVQKRIISRANALGKPVITATQMLGSMVDSRTPTRAEATDVANAVLDGTDAVMLSEETAVGRYPVETVRTMSRILAEAEPLLPPRREEPGADPADVMAHAACDTAARVGAGAIIVPTNSGTSARRIARYRPAVPILALTRREEVRRQLSLVWGVTALPVPWKDDSIDVLSSFREPVKGLVSPGTTVVVTAGWPMERPGTTNLVHVATM